ncbi:hypothetical protein D9M72_402280 [compost metagenome]
MFHWPTRFQEPNKSANETVSGTHRRFGDDMLRRHPEGAESASEQGSLATQGDGDEF